MRRERVDRLLVERGLAPSRTRAQALVMAGLVLVGEQRVEKPSETYPPDAPLRVRGAEDPAARYVGRGGLKLEKALAEFGVDARGLVCLDVGASTGGFTDCLLQHLKGGGRLIVLVKPQFEVGKGEVGKGGVVRDPAQHARVIEEVNACARSLGLRVRGVTESPVTGADGNREFLALYERPAR